MFKRDQERYSSWELYSLESSCKSQSLISDNHRQIFYSSVLFFASLLLISMSLSLSSILDSLSLSAIFRALPMFTWVSSQPFSNSLKSQGQLQGQFPVSDNSLPEYIWKLWCSANKLVSISMLPRKLFPMNLLRVTMYRRYVKYSIEY